MKNITKNLISVLALITIFSVVGANVSLAAVSKTASHVASSSGGSISAAPISPALMIPGPIISGMTVDNLTQTSAVLHASVNPNGLTTLTSFWTNVPGSTGPLEPTNVGSGNTSVPIVSSLTGLTPGTTYQFQVRATDSDGNTSISGWMSFITSSTSTPIIISATVDTITQTSALLHGTINPNGVDTLATFWIPSSLGPLVTITIGNGTLNVPTVFSLTGLTSSTNYMFEVRATNANGLTVNSGWISFSTSGSNNSCITPVISNLSPDHVTAGAGTTIVTVTGSDFGATSSAEINNSPRTTNVLNSTHLQMTLTASDVSSAGTKTITVNNGSGCESNALTFTINSAGGGGGGGGGSTHYVSVITQNAGNISNISAILNGSIDPNGRATTAWFEYGSSSNLSTYNETIHVNQGSADSASALAQSISNLSANTIYYFRAVANNTYGTKKGSIYSFQTLANASNPNGAITTVQATNKTSTSAKLNGVFFNKNGVPATGHFEYGKTASLGSSTADKDLGTSSVSFSKVAAGLAPNTIYFFRAVVESQGLTYKGNILVFQTPKISIPTTTSTTTTTTTTADVEPEVVTVESSILKITTNTEDVAIGNEIEYLITFKNTEKKNFENAEIIIQLPKEVSFIESNFGKEGDNDTVVFKPGILIPDQVGSMTIKGKVNSKASDDSVFITTAIMSYNIADSTENKDEIAYVTNHVIEGSGLEANPLFGADFLPTTLLGWLALMLVALGLIIVGKKIYEKYAMKTSRTGTADHIDHLPM